MGPFRSVLRIFTFILFCALGVAGVSAQSTGSGDIRGVVTDSTGALLPDVTVTIVNNDTGVIKVLTTNHDGLYDTAAIVIGNYSITFQKDGFAPFERSSITLQVGTSTVNASLKVGSAKDEVVVTTDIPLLKTESGEQSTTLEAKSMARAAERWSGLGELHDHDARHLGRGGRGQRPRILDSRSRPTAICRTATCWRMALRRRCRTARTRT